MKKVNFAGGEPFLYPGHLGKIVDFCKEILTLGSVSIVSNGSKITESWIKAHSKNVDILAISCDSFNEETNVAIGRGKGTHIKQLYQIADWSCEYGILFKLNSVICQYNWREDMNAHIARLEPYRWKSFQVLLVAGENDSDKTKRGVRNFLISDEDYEHFCRNHDKNTCFVPEPNNLMAKSYLILDEHLRFLDRTGQCPSGSILQVGVEKALSSVFWDTNGSKERGGIYAWNEEQIQKKQEDELTLAVKTQLGASGGGSCGVTGGKNGNGVDMEDIGVGAVH